MLESIFQHAAHSPLRLLAPAHQLLPRQQLCDSRDNELLRDLVPPLLCCFSQHSDQSQHEKLVLVDPLAQLLPRLPPLPQEIPHFGAVLEHEQHDWAHVDVRLGRQTGIGEGIYVFGGFGSAHGRGGSSESHAGAGFGHVFLFFFGGEFVAEVGLEAFGEVAGLAVVFLFVLKHLLDALLDQGAAVIVVHNFIIYTPQVKRTGDETASIINGWGK